MMVGLDLCLGLLAWWNEPWCDGAGVRWDFSKLEEYAAAWMGELAAAVAAAVNGVTLTGATW